MNCRRIEKIIPELVSGELDSMTARLAEEHVKSCQSCAAERAAYEEALGALSQPRAMVEVPDALDTLNLPEVSERFHWLRPAFATAALAAVMAGIILMPRAPQPVEHTTSVVRTPAKSDSGAARDPETVAKNTPSAPQAAKPSHAKAGKDSLQVHEPNTAPAKAGSLKQEAVIALGLRARGSTPEAGDSVRGYKAAGVAAEASEGEHEDLPESSVIVVACDIDTESVKPRFGLESAPTSAGPSVMYIESTDESTGSTAIYEYTRDSEGRERVIEIISNQST